MTPAIIAAALLLAAAPAHAVNKCTGPDGKVSFQDAPCEGKGEAVKVRPASGAPSPQAAAGAAVKASAELAEINRRSGIREAIERREPLIGMTQSELFQAMGQPNRANLANYNGVPHNQLIYERNGRTLYVYTDAGVVKAIQNSESISGPRRTAVRCPSNMEIRSMETSASSILLSEAEKIERLRQIGEARKCAQ
jgi:Domain of unknown function (DUF4124)